MDPAMMRRAVTKLAADVANTADDWSQPEEEEEEEAEEAIGEEP